MVSYSFVFHVEECPFITKINQINSPNTTPAVELYWDSQFTFLQNYSLLHNNRNSCNSNEQT